MTKRDERGGYRHGKGPKPMSVSGGRLRFTVELHPEETTIVSWAKFLTDASLSDPNLPKLPMTHSFEAQTSFVSQPPPPFAPYVV